MIEIKRATTDHVEGISKVCSAGWKNTYKDLLSEEYIASTIKEYYNHDRILSEVTNFSEEWYGWFVATENNTVLGAIGGGTTGEGIGDIFVLYLDPNRRGEGIGTKLLDKFTEIQKEKGIKEQWVSVAKNNMMGIPFYEAKGFVKVSERPSTEEEQYVTLRYRRDIS